MLKMLGYSSTDFTGSFPEAQLAKYYALGLNENISKTQGETLTRQDCMYLFYNLMSTKNKSAAATMRQHLATQLIPPARLITPRLYWRT